MIEIFYHTTDKDGYVVPGFYQSEDETLLFSEHVEAAKKEANTSGSNFHVDHSIATPPQQPSWVSPDWPKISFPKKTRKTYFGRYVD